MHNNTENSARNEHTEEAILHDMHRYLLGLGNLIEMEARQALTSFPTLMKLYLLLLPLLLLVWVSLSVFITFLSYSIYPSMLVAAGVCFALQVSALVALRFLIRQHLQKLSFSYSRSELSNLLKGFKGGDSHATQATDSATPAAASATTHGVR